MGDVMQKSDNCKLRVEAVIESLRKEGRSSADILNALIEITEKELNLDIRSSGKANL